MQEISCENCEKKFKDYPSNNTQIVYQSATASTYWIGADKKYKFRRIFKRFNFKKMGRGKPTPNHEYFLNIWV